MSKRLNKEQRKALKQQWQSKERETSRSTFPLPDTELEALFEHLDVELSHQSCDHSRRLTTAFLESRGHATDDVFQWLEDHGGYCDCEVLANVEEHWQENRA